MQEDENIEEYADKADFDYKKEGSWMEKLKSFIGGKYFVSVVIVLIAIISFSLGRVSVLQDKKPPVRIISGNTGPARLDGMSGGEVKGAATSSPTASVAPNTTPASQGGQVVASRNSTKYHYPWCAGAKQISPQNLITFNSIEEARTKGYTPASNCKGLK